VLVLSLNTLSLRVPSLREYTEDVPELLSYYVDKFVDSEHLSFKRFGVAAQNRLRNYPWPGNIRELSNLVYNLLLTTSDEEISLDEVEKELEVITYSDEPLIKQDILSMSLREARNQFERNYLQQQLILCNGKISKLAKRVGMERTNLYRKLHFLDINLKSLDTEDH
jgi:DNA-binding NtrC family response regulator